MTKLEQYSNKPTRMTTKIFAHTRIYKMSKIKRRDGISEC